MIKRMMALTSSLLFVAGGTPWSANAGTTNPHPGDATTHKMDPVNRQNSTIDIDTIRISHGRKLAQPVHYAVSEATVMPLWQNPAYRNSLRYKQHLLNPVKPRRQNAPARRTRLASRSGAVLTVHIEGGDVGVHASSIALRLVGTPYRWGGESIRGFDCSGFVRYVYAQFGIHLPRTSYEQFQRGTAVIWNGLRPGDLVFFSTNSSGPSHVALYIGNGLIVHALNACKGVIVSRLSDAYYRSHFVGARRL